MMKTKFYFLILFLFSLTSQAQVVDWQLYERLLSEGNPLPPHSIFEVEGTPTAFFSDTISIHHTCMPDSYIAYLGMDYTSRQVNMLFGNRTGYYLNDDPTGDLTSYLFDNGDVMMETKEGFGLCYFQTTTSRYYVQIGNMILKVGENVSSVQLPQGMVNEAVGVPGLVNIAILTRIELQGYDMVLCVGSEENVITYVHVGIDEGGI